MSTTKGESVGSRDGNPVTYFKLQLNGHDRFAGREGSYFNLKQIYDHHTATPQSCGVNVYSFALKPEEHQPSSAVNFSRIDKAVITLCVHPGTFMAVDPETCAITTTTARVRIYGVNYNIVRIMSGMAGIAYAN